MIDSLHKRYVCVSPVYRGGQLYNPGDILLLTEDETYSGSKFVLENPVVEPQPEQDPKPKKSKKMTSEVEA
ncbi:hypothetical protein SpiBuddy_1862 [Sphaerochaeta globosa str. Buddy]|uniref:Uncharacterized protein n=1 Tax=Sphaerochaeta globosa (strain ATCC BAA-1886 / DSM 22777 / Buddy) TaxID=158189 RepID=F0RWQ5_SPHGB|nr:hypothetical protein SpiBuddy_1862 [Sphaerochaeta globosa str. Buddy]